MASGMARRLSGGVQAGVQRLRSRAPPSPDPANTRLVSVGWPTGTVKGDEARLAIGSVPYDQPRHFVLPAKDGATLTVQLELNGKLVDI